MRISKASKKNIFLGTLFCLMVIGFALLYHFKVIKTLDLYNVTTYILYFVGIAFFYNGAYNRENLHDASAGWCFLFGGLSVLGAIFMLVYGLFTGLIVL